MKYPRPEAPRTRMKRIKREKANQQARQEQIPFELVERTMYGQRVWVKVYRPAWAQGDKREEERLGFKNPFAAKSGHTDDSTPTPWVKPKRRVKKPTVDKS